MMSARTWQTGDSSMSIGSRPSAELSYMGVLHNPIITSTNLYACRVPSAALSAHRLDPIPTLNEATQSVIFIDVDDNNDNACQVLARQEETHRRTQEKVGQCQLNQRRWVKRPRQGPPQPQAHAHPH